jgi:hypothetical protein
VRQALGGLAAAWAGVVGFICRRAFGAGQTAGWIFGFVLLGLGARAIARSRAADRA